MFIYRRLTPDCSWLPSIPTEASQSILSKSLNVSTRLTDHRKADTDPFSRVCSLQGSKTGSKCTSRLRCRGEGMAEHVDSTRSKSECAGNVSLAVKFSSRPKQADLIIFSSIQQGRIWSRKDREHEESHSIPCCYRCRSPSDIFLLRFARSSSPSRYNLVRFSEREASRSTRTTDPRSKSYSRSIW